MAGVRRALLFASGGRYVVMAVNLLATAITARLLTPGEFGLTVLGGAVFAIADALRELGSVAYLVQQQELTAAKLRTTFTVSLLVTAATALTLVLLSGPVAALYGDARLVPYLRVVALGYAVGPFMHPIYAMMSRDMAFGQIAFIDVSTAFLSNAVTVALLLLGFSYMSVAWAGAITAAVALLLGLHFRRDFSIYRPSLREWRAVLGFGAYGSATALLYRASESFSYLIFGKLLTIRDVALLQRAVLLSLFPERVVLAGLGAVALPAFSERARQGQELKTSYLGAIEHVTAVQWPALLLLALLAEPIVRTLLGPQWTEVVPLVRIFAVAFLFSAAMSLNYPVQVAAGGIRHTVPLALFQVLVSLGMLFAVSRFGREAIAWSAFVTIPVNVAASVLVVRRLVPFGWGEFAGALRRSAAVTLCTIAGPVLAMLLTGWHASMPLPGGIALAALGGAGWLLGIRWSGHPLRGELAGLLNKVLRRLGRQAAARP